MFEKLPVRKLRHSCAPPCPVPPSPDLIALVYPDYNKRLKSKLISADTTFMQYFSIWSSQRRGENYVGLDDGAVAPASSDTPQLITQPTVHLNGVISTLVLLVDFDDSPHKADSTPGIYEQ